VEVPVIEPIRKVPPAAEVADPPSAAARTTLRVGKRDFMNPSYLFDPNELR